jgi:hypothetical protein
MNYDGKEGPTEHVHNTIPKCAHGEMNQYVREGMSKCPIKERAK